MERSSVHQTGFISLSPGIVVVIDLEPRFMPAILFSFEEDKEKVKAVMIVIVEDVLHV